MNSSSELNAFSNTSLNNNLIVNTNGFSTGKKVRPCRRRKFINIAPLPQELLQKAVEEDDGENVMQPNERDVKCVNQVKENEQDSRNLQDSFEMNFAVLKSETPLKQNDRKAFDKYVTPIATMEHRFPPSHYITPINKTHPKIQCSVKVQSSKRTPMNRLSQVPECLSSLEKPELIKNQPLFDKIIVNNEKYIILNTLGKGGSSVVYHSYHCSTKVLRAIKVVSLLNPACADGFINEVKVLKELQQCNRIITMFDYEINEDKQVLYVVLEVGDADLAKILKENALNSSHMPLYMLLYYWMEMLYAIKQIHKNNIIHLDLKPANFMRVGGYLKLIDFGIASSVSTDMTSVLKTTTEGSFNYISPEALRGNASSNYDSPSFGKLKYKLSYKSDVWSLGCILYQLVYGRTPFQHISQVHAKLAVIMDPNHKIEYPNVAWLPQKLIDTMKACLQSNMKLRPSIDDLIAEYQNGLYYLLP